MGAGTTNKQKESQAWQDAATMAYYAGNALAAISGLCFASGLGVLAGTFFAGAAAGAYADAAAFQAISSKYKSKGR
jgi:hypothetical protein